MLLSQILHNSEVDNVLVFFIGWEWTAKFVRNALKLDWHFFTSFVATTADCGPPPVLLNGAVRYQNTTEGSEARYKCNDGFNLEGRRATVCGANGSWDSIPNCRPRTGKLTISLMACKMYTYIELTGNTVEPLNNGHNWDTTFCPL